MRKKRRELWWEKPITKAKAVGTLAGVGNMWNLKWILMFTYSSWKPGR